jgi:ABC-type Fe3+/spermidine/putrescine transport system ATPase subunit
MGNSFLEAVAISRLYPGKQLAGVKKASLSIEPGKITAIIGESGSGKSTLLRLLYGLLSPQEGVVTFKGERIWGPEEKLIPGHDAMKMVTQQTDNLNLHAKVWDNVSALLPSTDIKFKQERSEEVLTQLNMMKLADKKVAELSGGERQRVAIARALVTKPEVLLLDEPFNQVDTSFREGLQQDIRNVVKQTGITVVMVSHDPGEVMSMADHLVVFRAGEILETGDPKHVYLHPQHLYTARLLTNCNVLNQEEALHLKIKVEKECVVIYPEWIEIIPRWSSKDWEIKQVLFKGFYEDLLVQKDNLILRVITQQCEKFSVGDKISLKINRCLHF